MAESTKRLGKVAVLFGGRSAERDVSLMSGQGVLEALRSKGVNAYGFDPAERDLAELKREGFQCAFIALHGRWGEDGSVQGALELLGIPYTGSGVMASAICMDKITTKRLWQTENLPTPAYAVIDAAAQTQDSLAEVGAKLGYPLIFKAPHEGSTLGLAKVSDPSELQAGLAVAAALDGTVLAEQFIAGRELTIAVLGKGKGAKALPIVEIIAPGGNYDFQNKYYTDTTRYECPAQLPPELTTQLQRLAEKAFVAVGCEGWGRVDILLRNSDAKPFLLEINTSPGMTGHSLVPIAAKAQGTSYADLCVALLEQAALKIGVHS
jgi:D-alanine-D-alanine ligase